MNKLKNIFANKNTVIFIAIALFALLFLRQCNQTENLKREVEIAKEDSNRNFNNYLASKDTIRTMTSSNGSLVSEIRSYELDLSDLKDDQSILIKKYKNALNINKDLNKVNSLLSANIDIKDSIIVNTVSTEVDSVTTKLTFNKFNDFGDSNSRDLKGIMFVTKDSTGFNYGDATFDITHKISLLAAIENINGADQLKISTKYPGLTFTDIENINLINTKLNRKPVKKGGFAIGFGIGYGVNLNNNQIISYGPSIGVGLYYSPKWLRF